ncbi:hypothetical protein ABIC03_004383 [Bradyrhizobium sp. RT6a]
MISKPRKYNLDLIFYIKPNSIWNFNLICSLPVALSIGRDCLSIDHSSAHELMEATKEASRGSWRPRASGRLQGIALDGAGFWTTNMGNVKSKLWTRWLAPEHRCVVPFRSFSEFNNAVAGDETRPSLCFADIWTNWTSGREVKGGRRDHERALCVTFHGAERGGNSATGYSPSAARYTLYLAAGLMGSAP